MSSPVKIEIEGSSDEDLKTIAALLLELFGNARTVEEIESVLKKMAAENRVAVGPPPGKTLC